MSSLSVFTHKIFITISSAVEEGEWENLSVCMCVCVYMCEAECQSQSIKDYTYKTILTLKNKFTEKLLYKK